MPCAASALRLRVWLHWSGCRTCAHDYEMSLKPLSSARTKTRCGGVLFDVTATIASFKLSITPLSERFGVWPRFRPTLPERRVSADDYMYMYHEWSSSPHVCLCMYNLGNSTEWTCIPQRRAVRQEGILVDELCGNVGRGSGLAPRQ